MPKRINRWMSVSDEVAGPAKVYLYGVIGESWYEEGVTSKEFAEQLDALSPRDIDLYVNSPGGNVFEGYAMYAQLKRYPGKVTAYVDGVAMSAASYLILAADTVVMGKLAALLIHNCWNLVVGNAVDMRDMADRLDVIDEQIIGIYENKSAGKKTAADFRDAMAVEMRFSAEEAVEWGLADSIEEGLKAAACITKDAARFFARIPESIQIVDELPEPPCSSEPPSDTTSIVDTEGGEAPDGQEPKSVDGKQEPVAKQTVALASGIYEFNA